jgi:hypothetical protein
MSLELDHGNDQIGQHRARRGVFSDPQLDRMLSL